MRPGRDPRARPTGAPQSEREQNRFLSGTSGFSCTAPRGSGRGTCGTDTRPTPSLPRADEAVDEPELRTDADRADVPSDRERDSRPETERRDDEDREERVLPRVPVLAEPRELREPRPLRPLRPPTVTPVAGEPTMPLADTTGARPHVSQYSSPPPTSSYEPVHLGR
ncbi:hypothetical protein GCM10010252_14200 [Streptomyces aureoverticillatus]|nr:hypothetical protein GCM10010252_14200 [Streptomyces aureoverticillatus]